MSLIERLQRKVSESKVKECELFGEKVLCRMYSTKQFRKAISLWPSEAGDSIGDENEQAKEMSNWFLDPDTWKPVFSPEFILDEMPQNMAIELLQKFGEVNNPSLEQAEKN